MRAAPIIFALAAVSCDGGGLLVASPACTTASTSSAAECAAAECDPAEGDAEKKASCDDGYPKTADRCVALGAGCGAVCAHVTVSCDWLDGPGAQGEACDDGDPCTTDSCAFPTACRHAPIAGCAR